MVLIARLRAWSLSDVIDMGELAGRFAAAGSISRLRELARQRTRCGATFTNTQGSKLWPHAFVT